MYVRIRSEVKDVEKTVIDEATGDGLQRHRDHVPAMKYGHYSVR